MSFNVYNLLWLLLPLAAGSGWLGAKIDQKRRVRRNAFDLPSAYFKGLNFLLNEQPDKAIEVFTQVLEVNSETVETHLALGNLFRRRGEVERAIRIHQNLIARPTLDKEQRSHALLELGQDYLKAGLFDRAENLFLELAEIRLHSEQALRLLLRIYQQEKEWHKAISSARKLARLSGEKMNSVIAHYNCELAELAYSKKDYLAARAFVREALSNDRKCVRANILLGDIEAEGNRHRDAIKAWKHIEEQDAHFLGDVADKIADSYRRLGDENGVYEFFRSALERHQLIGLVLTFAEIIRDREGIEAAEKFVVESLRRRPSVHGLHRLIELNLAEAQESNKDDLMLLRNIIEELREQHRGYACQQCGFRGKSLHWLCPGCNRWSTIKPILEE
ncbi:MAG: lipopolysaccharide assembly protein LapB [Gammaproteobacteria bacterium]|jgi:lipopolysaccharide biosynthesis regulator YciM|nr:lipopolysaccharide assembly protein LapB [Gammaproteobacteria bacterium]